MFAPLQSEEWGLSKDGFCLRASAEKEAKFGSDQSLLLLNSSPCTLSSHFTTEQKSAFATVCSILWVLPAHPLWLPSTAATAARSAAPRIPLFRGYFPLSSSGSQLSVPVLHNVALTV